MSELHPEGKFLSRTAADSEWGASDSSSEVQAADRNRQGERGKATKNFGSLPHGNETVEELGREHRELVNNDHVILREDWQRFRQVLVKEEGAKAGVNINLWVHSPHFRDQLPGGQCEQYTGSLSMPFVHALMDDSSLSTAWWPKTRCNFCASAGRYPQWPRASRHLRRLSRLHGIFDFLVNVALQSLLLQD